MARPRQNRAVDLREERAHDATYRETLVGMGALARKIEAKHIKGLPDTYIAPNVWIEFKKIRWLSTRAIEPLGHFDPLQLFWLREFEKSGCACYIGIFWDFGSRGAFVQTIDFRAACNNLKFTRDLAEPYSWPISELREHVRTTWTVEGRRASISPSADAAVRLTGPSPAAW